MNQRHWIGGLSILLLLVGISFANRAATFAQNGDHLYLPLVISSQQQNPSQPIPTATLPAANNPWMPPPTATATATPQRTYPAWVPGTYNIRAQRLEGWGEYRADGTFAEQFSTFGAPGIQKATGEWFVADGELVVEFTNQTGQAFRRHFLIEEIAGEGFRIAAGDAKLTAYLYERMTPVKAVDGQYVSHWMRGRWDSIFPSYAWLFHEDGSYDRYETSFSGELKTLIEAGQWSAVANQMVIQPAGAILVNSTYTITTATEDFLQIVNQEKAGWSLWRKNWYPSASMNEYDGQYITNDTTLTIVKDGETNYAATLLMNGVPNQATGRVDDYGRLVLTSANGQSYPPLQRYFNALFEQGPVLPKWLTKVSETTLPAPENYDGFWVEANSELSLLPDGRYIRLFHSIQNEGTYAVEDGIITFDPLCERPYTYTVSLIGNQMVQTSGSTVFTHHYVPRKLPDVLASIAQRDEAEAVRSAEFAAHTPLAAVDPTYITPVVGEVSLDPNRTDIYPNATTFAEPQVYDFYSDVTYYFDERGYFIAVTPLICAINPDFCRTIDYGRGSWKDKFHYYFYPNGRFLIYYETYYNATSLVPVTPTIQRWWGKYKIEHETIISESTQFPLLLGRRRAMHGENCLDNIGWSDANLLR